MSIGQKTENTSRAMIRIQLMFQTETEYRFYEHKQYYQEDLDTRLVALEFNEFYDSDFEVINDESAFDLYNRIGEWISREIS